MKNQRHPVLVMGATGLVGGLVAQGLRSLDVEVRAATRSPQESGDVRLDLVDPMTFEPALKGVRTAMLISRPGDEAAHVHAAPLVEAMVRAGVTRVVVLSALGSGQRPEFSLRKVEQLVEGSGMSWVHVRPNFFMQMLALPPLSTEISRAGTLSLPLGEARVAYVDAADVAGVLVHALLHEGLNGSAIDVSGPDALDHLTIARSIANEIGADVKYVALGESQARELLAGRGYPADHAERLMRFYALIREGWCARPDDGEVAGLLGRPLRRWDALAREMRGAWMRV